MSGAVKVMWQDINPTLSNESSGATTSSLSGRLALGFSGLSNPHRHIQGNALKSLFV